MRHFFVAAAALLLIAALPRPVAGQERELVLTLYGGGADHLADLQQGPPVWFMPGYAVGASVGLQLTPSFAIRGDFTYTRNPAERRTGSTEFSSADINRFYYGVTAELRRDIGAGVIPFVFAGAGAVTLDQLGPDQFRPTTKPALMGGGGLSYNIRRTPLAISGAVEGSVYRWDMAGFDRTMLDVTYTVGLSYRIGF